MSRVKDPTLTLTARGKAIREVNSRFNKIKYAITHELVTNQALGPNGRFNYLRDAEKVTGFVAWLNTEIEANILTGASAKEHWLNTYISRSYYRAALKTRAPFVKKFDLPANTIFESEAHIQRSELIFTRVYSGLKGVTQTMESQISRVLSDGILKGDGAKVIARNLNYRVDKIGKVRARLIARTEIVNAHNVSSITEAQNLEDAIGQEVKMQWQTAIDGRERDSHKARHKKIYTRKQALGLIGEPNCRCSVSAWIKEFGKRN